MLDDELVKNSSEREAFLEELWRVWKINNQGPWTGEPDREFFIDEHTKYPCFLSRSMEGAWCGYVGIPCTHPFYNKQLYEIKEEGLDADIDVHGGLTYSEKCELDPENGVYQPSDGKDVIWWVGFDCAHKPLSLDLSPFLCDERFIELLIGIRKEMGLDEGKPTYKDIGYARKECKKLASQLLLVGNK